MNNISDDDFIIGGSLIFQCLNSIEAMVVGVGTHTTQSHTHTYPHMCSLFCSCRPRQTCSLEITLIQSEKYFHRHVTDTVILVDDFHLV